MQNYFRGIICFRSISTSWTGACHDCSGGGDDVIYGNVDGEVTLRTWENHCWHYCFFIKEALKLGLMKRSCLRNKEYLSIGINTSTVGCFFFSLFEIPKQLYNVTVTLGKTVVSGWRAKLLQSCVINVQSPCLLKWLLWRQGAGLRSVTVSCCLQSYFGASRLR